jgi:WYL domain-containing protein
MSGSKRSNPAKGRSTPRSARRGSAADRDNADWRLARRGPILAYDEYSDEEIELSIGQRDPESIEGLLIDFRYAARDGEFSRRSVLCWQCGRDGDRLYVRGYCAFREELRTFRVDRMGDVIAIQGGRESAVEDTVAFFAAFAARETSDATTKRRALPN